MKEHGWEEHTLPGWIKSHVHPDHAYKPANGMVLIPTFRLPTLIHTRTGSAKWLNEISNNNPLWMHPQDMKARGLRSGDLVRVNTDIGYFVDRVWATEAIKPGVAACSHHLGRWRRKFDPNGNRFSSSEVELDEKDKGKWLMRRNHGVRPFKSDDPDSSRIFWEEGGVHQNAAAPAHPDPISGANCWLQNVVVEKAKPEDHYGDVYADTDKAFDVYKEWKSWCRPVKEGNLRRIAWLNRPLKPVDDAWKLGGGDPKDIL
jgi:anaerobic selenocysteine-containing dehydrogenase